MSNLPKIQRAIPQRRYQYGDYGVTVLGEVDSADAHDYQFVAAFVKDGESQPRLFVVSERLPPGQRERGRGPQHPPYQDLRLGLVREYCRPDQRRLFVHLCDLCKCGNASVAQ